MLHAGEALFKIQMALGETAFPSSVGWYDPPTTRFMSITNQTGTPMPITFLLPPLYYVDPDQTQCGSSLNPGESCVLAVGFNPSQIGRFSGQAKVCGSKIWCSIDPVGFDITVTNTDIVSTQCSEIQSRPFAALDCAGSYAYAQNFASLVQRALPSGAAPGAPSGLPRFQYFQHTPSVNETTTPCLQAKQTGVTLDSLIEGGGVPLCNLMQYATGNSGTNATLSKLYPPYLTLLLGTAYPITSTTIVLQELTTLLTNFGHTAMDSYVQNLGYFGYVNFLTNYYQQLTPNSIDYSHCGTSAICPSLYYLPYPASENTLKTWPPSQVAYWGMSGGGGSGAGYQIGAFRPGSATHYTLFSGGGGGGGGNTTPEGTSPNRNLINTGSGGGGGSQFASCYVTNEGNLNGLGLGAGTGSGLSALEGDNILYQAPPAVSYSYYPPNLHPNWPNNEILTKYGTNLTNLLSTLIPQLYNEGYTIAITGGGGGGSGLEFLNSLGVEYQPLPVSIGYGFNFCYLFNKAGVYSKTDCNSSPNASLEPDAKPAPTLDDLIYKNTGTFFNAGMQLAVSACTGGYSNYQCTCSFQHAYVICEITNLLVANGYSSADIPAWLRTPHCNETADTLMSHGVLVDQLSLSTVPKNCAKAIGDFFTAQTSTACVPPWSH
jgi:hypothetical protein